ncbi:CRISPR-associated Csx2 family protein [Anoxybacillus tengchongensis]|uniref:CRISPR-associated Csx2 family protein n=1 Tax=Anoxybacillus tengchongensis TaxID=576944 RepID=A0A7W9YTI4_9BACL|nr:TIGR02221 family CRISPR-associated protein [Anoxybacillus tengchongensis]MBB6177937.1 CRISPR-associated Csx2 family protein [Anoxybacillus tengchongensis]
MKLLTFLGANDYRETTYRFRERVHTAKFFLSVLIQELQPDEIYVFMTDGAREKNEAPLFDELKQYGVDEKKVHAVRIPDGQTEEDLWNIFSILADQVHENDSIVLDITHGFRTLPLVGTISLQYLKFVKQVHIAGVYYGAFEARKTEHINGQEVVVAPTFDLTPFVHHLPEWQRAANELMAFGDAKTLGSLLESLHNQLRKQNIAVNELKRFGNYVNDISAYLRTGRIKSFTQLFSKSESILQQEQLLKEIEQFVPPVRYIFHQLVNYVQCIAPKQSRLHTYYDLAIWYGDHHLLSHCFIMLREMIVSLILERVLDEIGPMPDEREFRYDPIRKKGERLLITLLKQQEKKKLHNPLLKELAEKLHRLTNYRNDLGHFSFRTDHVPPKVFYRFYEEEIKSYKLFQFLENEQLWKEFKTWHEEQTIKEEAKETILITPLGLSKGLLYSAIVHNQPEAIWLLTSKESAKQVNDVCQQADFHGNVHVVVMEDPYTDFNRWQTYMNQFVHAIETDNRVRFVVNLTGGTTAMQYVIQQIAERLKEKGEHVQYVAQVDRRPVNEQQENPYVLGEQMIVEGH